MLYRASSFPTMAVMRSGLLLLAVSIRVLTFHAPKYIDVSRLPVLEFLLDFDRPQSWMPSQLRCADRVK